MKLRIEKYEEMYDSFLCRDEENRTFYVDLRADDDANIPEDNGSIIGRVVEVDSVRMYLGIARNPRMSAGTPADEL